MIMMPFSVAATCDNLHNLSPTLVFTDFSDPAVPALAGTNTTFSCISDYNSSASNMVVTFCMNNGKWEPDPLKLCMITGNY